MYGHNNLPDNSNMCHEATSVRLKRVTGSSVGTCILADLEQRPTQMTVTPATIISDHYFQVRPGGDIICDLILFFGQNTGTNSPRFLHKLQKAKERDRKIVTFNPIRERGLMESSNPITLAGLIKRVLGLDAMYGGVLDRAFLAEHTKGLEEMEACMAQISWAEIEATSGLGRVELASVGDLYAGSKRVIGVYGMGLTQHVHGWLNLAMLVKLLLLRGNIGREGARVSPVRGHSNVRGQRTVGISEKPELVPLDRLAELFDFEPPRETGMTAVEVAAGVLDGSVNGFVALGGNFARAISDNARVEQAWSGLDLNVQIATELNRSHLVPGESSWLMSCLVRSEERLRATGPQAVSMEDSLSMIYGSLGKRQPAAPDLKSEVAIVAGIAKATLPPNPKARWDEWTGAFSLIRDLIEATWPNKFGDFNGRLFTPGGFYKGNAARDRHWETESGKAEFTPPETLSSLGQPPIGEEMTLITLRPNDQFNTTIYGLRDRLRRLEGSRDILLMNPGEMKRRSLDEGQRVTVECVVGDGTERVVRGLRVTPYDLPDACTAAYYPGANPLIPLGYHDELSKTPAYKGVPVRIRVEVPVASAAE